MCYTRFISLVLESMLKEEYNTPGKGVQSNHHVAASLLNTPGDNEVPLTYHMLQIAGLPINPSPFVIPSSEEVNTVNPVDKSLSETNVQQVTQSIEGSADIPQEKSTPASSQHKVSKQGRKRKSPITTTHPQHAEELVASAEPTQSLEVPESAGHRTASLKPLISHRY